MPEGCNGPRGMDPDPRLVRGAVPPCAAEPAAALMSDASPRVPCFICYASPRRKEGFCSAGCSCLTSLHASAVGQTTGCCKGAEYQRYCCGEGEPLFPVVLYRCSRVRRFHCGSCGIQCVLNASDLILNKLEGSLCGRKAEKLASGES